MPAVTRLTYRPRWSPGAVGYWVTSILLWLVLAAALSIFLWPGVIRQLAEGLDVDSVSGLLGCLAISVGLIFWLIGLINLPTARYEIEMSDDGLTYHNRGRLWHTRRDFEWAEVSEALVSGSQLSGFAVVIQSRGERVTEQRLGAFLPLEDAEALALKIQKKRDAFMGGSGPS
jgi:hypothetical protein